MITLDSSAVIALFDTRDSHHAATNTALRRERLVLLPAAALGEIAYFVERRHGQEGVARFVRQLIADVFRIEAGVVDLPRTLELIERYADLPLGFVDAAVIACAKRNGGRVLTSDYRHFAVVAGEGTITLVQ